MPKLLLVKLGAIGDVILTLPAAYAMHAAGYEIDWVCGHSVAPLLSLYPWINVIAIDDKRILRGSAIGRTQAITALWRRLLGGHYDIIATFYYDTRYKLLTLPIRGRRKITLSETDRSFRLIPGRHHTSEYARILLAETPPPRLITDGESPAQLAPIVIPAMLPPTTYPRSIKQRIVLVPAGARNMMRDSALRRWPVESYAELAKVLLARGFEIVLLGGPDDAWASPFFTGMPLTDLIGKLSLLESIAMLNSANVVVTHDTGPLHMAGLTRAAIVAIFGPTDPHVLMPQRENVVALWGGEGFACRPCHDGRDFAPCTHNGCVRQITTTMVLGEIETLLIAAGQNRPLLPRIRTPKHTPVLTQILP